MDERIDPVAAEGFDRAAEVYERARPTYPADAVAHVVAALGIAPGRRILDLAAGTGKLTRLLVPTGADVVAVEPVAGMRAQLAAALPGLEVLDGTAEALPLADASLDGITCAQAWHWFDGPVALAEAARVLRPHGALAVIFNIRDERIDWVEQITTISDFHAANRPHHRRSRAVFADDVAASGRFAPVEVATFRHVQVLDEELLVARVASQSNVAIMDEARRADVLGRIRALARTHPALAGRARFELPYTTEVACCRLLSATP